MINLHSICLGPWPALLWRNQKVQIRPSAFPQPSGIHDSTSTRKNLGILCTSKMGKNHTSRASSRTWGWSWSVSCRCGFVFARASEICPIPHPTSHTVLPGSSSFHGKPKGELESKEDRWGRFSSYVQSKLRRPSTLWINHSLRMQKSCAMPQWDWICKQWLPTNLFFARLGTIRSKKLGTVRATDCITYVMLHKIKKVLVSLIFDIEHEWGLIRGNGRAIFRVYEARI